MVICGGPSVGISTGQLIPTELAKVMLEVTREGVYSVMALSCGIHSLGRPAFFCNCTPLKGVGAMQEGL